MQNTNGFHHIVVVVERLSHAHQNDVKAVARLPGKVVALRNQDLTYDLAGAQMARQPKLPCEAERTGQGAADLRRNANGAAVFFRNEYRFGEFAVAEPHQIAPRSIGRIEPAMNRGQLNVPLLSERGTGGLR